MVRSDTSREVHTNSVGNYIISGGKETVLIIWQLETGHKQFLPHLSFPIESLVVSPSGSSYAMRMADNSVMVLSTAELKPTCSIAGIQYLSSYPKSDIYRITTIDRTSADIRSLPLRIPVACVSKYFPGRLFLAVPSFSPSILGSNTVVSAAYLQTVDVQSAQQLSRQALTRTNITDRNMGPEGNTIEEPNVTHVQVSHNGKWLATVDEWTPPRGDLGFLVPDEKALDEEQASRIEIYLKFWLWNQDKAIWELVSRINHPHRPEPSAENGVGYVHDLVSDPTIPSFSTIGDDGYIRIWRPRRRRRDGIIIRGTDGEPLYNWSCRCAVALRLGLHKSSPAKGSKAKLAYSADGSLLAASCPRAPFSIYLIDVEKGEIRMFLNRIYPGVLLGLGVLGRYMIMLSDMLQVWDLVHNEFHYGFELNIVEGPEQTRSEFLAVDTMSNTFAMSRHTTVGEDRRHLKNPVSQICVFNPEDGEIVFSTTLNCSNTLLLPAAGRKGYYSLNENSELQILSPPEAVPVETPNQQPVVEKRLGGLESVYGTGSIQSSTAPPTQQDEFPVVRQDELSALLDTGAPIPPRELFTNVASLFAKKAPQKKI